MIVEEMIGDSSHLSIHLSSSSKFLHFCLDGPREHPLTGPENQFGFVGSDVNFTCISPVGYCVGMNWFKQKVGRGRETISISRFGNYSRAKYTVMGSRMGCQLTVKRLELNDASSVICEIVISHRTYEGTASLLVFSKLSQTVIAIWS